TKDKMTWVTLKFEPPPPEALRDKGGMANIEVMGNLLKFIAKISGIKPSFPAEPRGFLGFEAEVRDDHVLLKAVLKGSPADAAGLQAGDRIETINTRNVASLPQIE